MSKKNNTPTTLVILGATGDLVSRKIVPAVFRLYRTGQLPDRFRVMGFSRRDLSDTDFREYIRGTLASVEGTSPTLVNSFLGLFYYTRGEFESDAHYADLSQRLTTLDDEWGTCTNKLFYLAVPPKLYETIFRAIATSGLSIPCGGDDGWTRVIVEKPFGSDLQTAKALDELLGKLFKESQIYRIDHYLAKEMLQNILTFRFANNLFENIWDQNSVERIHVRLFEKLGTETRGAFYDSVGALRDVGQNHLLQMLALATMDQPREWGSEAIREKRLKVLKALRQIEHTNMPLQAFRAQYDGYRTSKGVNESSNTETYFKVRTTLDLQRWKDVPVIIEGGKQMHESKKEIRIILKHPTPCFCNLPDGGHHKNEIVIRLEPIEEIEIFFWAKKPGLVFENELRTLHFHLRADKDGERFGEYDRLLLDCIGGDQTLFVSTDEIRAMWGFIDPIANFLDFAILLSFFFSVIKKGD